MFFDWYEAYFMVSLLLVELNILWWECMMVLNEFQGEILCGDNCSICVRNSSVILSPTLAKNEKVEHYIRIKTHKPIALRFWVESGVNSLCGWAQVSLVLYLPSETPSVNLTICIDIWIQYRGTMYFSNYSHSNRV